MRPVFSKLPEKQFNIPPNKLYLRVMMFDPTPCYQNVTVDVFKRIQTSGTGLHMGAIFPQKDAKVCACGCGAGLSGRRTRWASVDCTHFALNTWRIIQGHTKTIATLLRAYNDDIVCCQACGEITDCEVDHIVPVHKGGGGCWLSNYQFLCKSCHLSKSIKERRLK